MKCILVTGAAGFIGASICEKLAIENADNLIVGIDNLNSYYEISLKKYRLNKLKKFENFVFVKTDISDKNNLLNIFKQYRFEYVINLAAQAGVRYSIENPDIYITSNVIGFYNILEACKVHNVKHLVYASSSSVYGGNKKIPFSISDNVDKPVSLYAATKKSNELLAYSYSKLYNIPTTGLRFFTVYGPAGRPDMAYFSFTNALVNNKKIKVFNNGNCQRDFTYIDDIVEGISRVLRNIPKKGIGGDGLPIAPYKIYNIGNSHPENLLVFIKTLFEQLVLADVLPKNFNLESHLEFLPMQPGDVPVTYADTSDLEKDVGFKPTTSLKDGLCQFAQWYSKYYLKKE
mgnify:CR=1 FL=1